MELELRRVQGKARVWFRELPACDFRSSEVIERSLPSVKLETRRKQCVAVELFTHAGGYCPYGLLGAEFVPQDSHVLLLQVSVSSADGRCFDAALAGAIDEVRFGLPREYAEGVLDGAAAAGAIHVLGSGVLRFRCAAHGKVGSSSNHFRRLAMLVVQLLCLNTESITEEEVAGLIESRDSEPAHSVH